MIKSNEKDIKFILFTAKIDRKQIKTRCLSVGMKMFPIVSDRAHATHAYLNKTELTQTIFIPFSICGTLMAGTLLSSHEPYSRPTLLV